MDLLKRGTMQGSDYNSLSRNSAMELPLQITFRHMFHSDAIEAMIRERAEKLDKFWDHIMSCRVVVEPLGKHHQHGNLYDVKIEITVPGSEIVATRAPGDHEQNKDIYVAIREAFDAARRQLEDYGRLRRKEVKAHAGPPEARVSRLFPHEDFGFLQTLEGREVYFHRHSVANDGFDRLQVGSRVRFNEEMGNKGPQATVVNPE